MSSGAQERLDRLADTCEEYIGTVLQSEAIYPVDHAQVAAAVRDLAEAAVILRWQRLPGRETLR